jgi:hypothetical protein
MNGGFMRLELKKIEATLKQLAAQNATDDEQQSSWEKNPIKQRASNSAIQKRETTAVSQEVGKTGSSLKVPSFSTSQYRDPNPRSPIPKQASFIDRQRGMNPYLPMMLLKEIEATVIGWQSEHKQILQQIQDLYGEGPIIEGWLESDKDQKYWVGKDAHSIRIASSFAPSYRLCGVDSQGKVWSRTVPAQHLPSVSMAIARYQKLQQLLSRKQQLETRLNELAQILFAVQDRL